MAAVMAAVTAPIRRLPTEAQAPVILKAELEMIMLHKKPDESHQTQWSELLALLTRLEQKP